MRVLIATSSRHGSTHELGQWLSSALADALKDSGVSATVDTRDAADVDSIAEYDAAIIGSAVYMGRWLRASRSLVAREQPELQTRPVWLFSSGPIGNTDTSTATSPWDKASWAVEHRIFGGRLHRSELSWFEKLVVRLIRAKDGDDRSRDAVEEWARSISTTLAAAQPTVPVQP
ncbi:flavodoxin domain-containing protein [Rhodococcus sp. G-MC3]|uniref:flavodoxin domain-containing protein n=1 Tax=Rhodococcus sp. G-MC3 TaxID=3046209 RepID=UPI0024BB349E|nr:flavodoxin domain-containing protein [Rhodococcus sp. G-MC3]MDJ0394826.1 flavodoxin domain-containing protein [Rhodococcus sp. G-MC3]